MLQLIRISLTLSFSLAVSLSLSPSVLSLIYLKSRQMGGTKVELPSPGPQRATVAGLGQANCCPTWVAETRVFGPFPEPFPGHISREQDGKQSS